MKLEVALIALFIYLIIMVWAGLYARRWVSDSSEFMLAGREFGMLANVMELCAIALAGSLMTFLPSLVIRYGLRTALIQYVLVLGLGYALYGVMYGKLARDSGAQSVAEYLELRFDFKVRTLIAILTSFAMLGIAANNVLSIAKVINQLLGIPQFLITTICFAIIIIFSVAGGFWGITFTDMIQLIIGEGAVIALLIYLYHRFGGRAFLVSHFPSVNLWTTGTAGEGMRFFSLRYPSGLTMILNFMVFLLWGNNYYFLRLNTCRSGKEARNSYLIGGLICVPFLLAPVTLIGVYAASIYPEQFWGRYTVDGASVMTILINHLPVFLKAVMAIGFLAITVSTASTALIGVAATVSRDVWKRRFRPDLTQKEELKAQRWIMFFVAVAGWGLCFYPGDAVQMFGFVTSWLGPAAILVLMAAACPRFTAKGAFWGTVFGILLLTLSAVLDLMGTYNIVTRIHSSILGMLPTLVIGSVISLFTKSSYYGERKWKRWKDQKKEPRVILSSFDYSVLEMIRFGSVTMAEITDYLGCDSRISKLSVETLDKGGYIVRKGLRFSGFFHFEITQKGSAVLPELSEAEEKLLTAGLSIEQFEFLVCAERGQKQLQKFIEKKRFHSLQTTAIVSVLDQRGYVKQRGIMKRCLKVTKKGAEVIGKNVKLLKECGEQTGTELV